MSPNSKRLHLECFKVEGQATKFLQQGAALKRIICEKHFLQVQEDQIYHQTYRQIYIYIYIWTVDYVGFLGNHQEN